MDGSQIATRPIHDSEGPRKARSQQERDWADRIRRVARILHALHHPSTRAFSLIGERLNEFNEASPRLAALASELNQRFGSDSFDDMVAALGSSLTLIQELTEDDSERAAGLAGTIEATGKVRSALQQLGGTMFRINVLGVNAKVQSARLDGTETDFTVFNREIGQLAKRGSQALDEIGEHLDDLERCSESAIKMHTRFKENQVVELRDLAERLTSSLGLLLVRQDRAATALSELPQLLEASADMAGDIVVRSQTNDIIRQRLEAREASLNASADLLTGEGACASITLAEREERELIVRQCQAQSRGITAAIGEFESDAETITARLAKVRENLETSRGLCVEIYSREDGQSGSFLHEIRADLNRAHQIIEIFLDATVKTDHNLSRVAEISRTITKVVKTIEAIDADMHLMGLNASIKCGNLGSHGRALNVVAQEIQGYAKQTRTLTHEINHQITVIESSAEEIAGTNTSGTRDFGAELRESVGFSLSTIKTMESGTHAILDKIERRCKRLEGAIGETLRSFDIRDRFTDAGMEAESYLSSLEAECGDDRDEDRDESGETFEALLSKLASSHIPEARGVAADLRESMSEETDGDQGFPDDDVLF